MAHAIPTRLVVAGFGPMTTDNRLVITQEWLAEAFTMWGVAAFIVVTTAVGGAEADATGWFYRVAAGLLVALAALTALTGARTPVIWFKICPVFLSPSAAVCWSSPASPEPRSAREARPSFGLACPIAGRVVRRPY